MQPNDTNQSPLSSQPPLTNSAQIPIQPATPPPPASNNQPQSKKKLLILIIAAVVIILGAAVAALLFFNSAKAPSRGPTLSVGSNPYIYACSVFTTDTVVEELKFNPDKSKQVAEETYAYAPFDTTNKEVDILKATGRQNIPSVCRVKTDIRFETGPEGKREPTFVSATLTLQQFTDELSAVAKYTETKSQAKGAKSLASLKDTSFYTDPKKNGSGSNYLNVFVRHKNMLLGYSAPLGNQTDDQQAARIEKIHQDVIRRIDTGEGKTPKDYTGLTKLGNNSYVDICQNTDFSKITEAIGSNKTEFDLTLFNSYQNYSPSDLESKSPQVLGSICNIYFRTEKDIAAQSALAQQQPQAEFVNFPHHLMLQLLTAKSSEDAQKYVANFKQSGVAARERDPKTPEIKDVQLGDKAIKLTMPADAASPFDSYLHYIAKDSRVYVISILKKKQTEPYKTDDAIITDSQMEKIYNAMASGATYAQSKLKP